MHRAPELFRLEDGLKLKRINAARAASGMAPELFRLEDGLKQGLFTASGAGKTAPELFRLEDGLKLSFEQVRRRVHRGLLSYSD